MHSHWKNEPMLYVLVAVFHRILCYTHEKYVLCWGSRGGRRRIPVRKSARRYTFNYSSFRTGVGERIRVLSSVQSTNCASLPRMTPTCLVLNVRLLVKKFAREQLQRELMSNSIDHCCLSEALAKKWYWQLTCYARRIFNASKGPSNQEGL